MSIEAVFQSPTSDANSDYSWSAYSAIALRNWKDEAGAARNLPLPDRQDSMNLVFMRPADQALLQGAEQGLDPLTGCTAERLGETFAWPTLTRM